MTRRHTLTVKLRRPSRSVPWGISIAGGSDLGTPLVVTRSENEELQKGDVIKKIDEYDVRDLRHVDAQTLLSNSESVKLAIERSESYIPSRTDVSSSSIIIDNNNNTQLSSRTGTVEKPKSTQVPPVLPKSPVPPPVPIDVPEFTRCSLTPERFTPSHEHIDEVREERFYLSQPYRTTPLVLPGAKIKKDAPLGECYLRHHPNPMVRAPPHHYEVANPEVAMKQKVVHKQFNSPIGLYSEQNIADTIKCQASAIPKKPGKYDPSQSEAYKALQEEGYDDHIQHVSQPTRQGVFSPQKARQNRPAPFRPKSPGINIVDGDGETIHQSNSFKRIMYSVLGQTDY
ncbi:Z band alternatively spliced PDZ-motif protein 66 isoform X2 [Nasonia vitripennis]|uniref:PDZ domain-containing protein n=1 Tax=Nasonia vitripennis TaxID=7425 RepID=A0A7M7QUF1_NASVI|nr:Z band alternatively spliced PDZ-motif protein 66 isoform X2 [Nasonia vitripennis]